MKSVRCGVKFIAKPHAGQLSVGLSYPYCNHIFALQLRLVLAYWTACRWRGTRCCYRKLDLLRGGELPAAHKGTQFRGFMSLRYHEHAAMSPRQPLFVCDALHPHMNISEAFSNAGAGKSLPSEGSTLPNIQPAPPNKGAPSHPATPSRTTSFPKLKGHPYANATTSSSSSTTDTISELTSSSSRDSLPAAHAPGSSSSTTPQKQTRNYRRTKSNKSAVKWSDPASQSKTSQNAVHILPKGITTQAQARLMATAFGGPSGDSRRGVSSPRPKGRGMSELA